MPNSTYTPSASQAGVGRARPASETGGSGRPLPPSATTWRQSSSPLVSSSASKARSLSSPSLIKMRFPHSTGELTPAIFRGVFQSTPWPLRPSQASGALSHDDTPQFGPRKQLQSASVPRRAGAVRAPIEPVPD